MPTPRLQTIPFRRRLSVLALLSLAALLLFLFVYQVPGAPLSSAFGNFLWLRHDLEDADFLYILGGDYLRRIPLAAQIYHAGLTRKIVIPWEQMPPDRGAQEHFTTASERILREKGVPASAIEIWRWQDGVHSTNTEMFALAAYLRAHPGLRRMILLTSQYHTRRAYYTALAVWRRSQPEIRVVGTAPDGWRLAHWQSSPQGRNIVLKEYAGLLLRVPSAALSF